MDYPNRKYVAGHDAMNFSMTTGRVSDQHIVYVKKEGKSSSIHFSYSILNEIKIGQHAYG